MFSKPHFVRVDDHGRTVVPAHLRRELGLCRDDVLLRREQDDRLPRGQTPGLTRRVRTLAARLVRGAAAR